MSFYHNNHVINGMKIHKCLHYVPNRRKMLVLFVNPNTSVFKVCKKDEIAVFRGCVRGGES